MGESVLHLASRRTASIRAKQGDDVIEIPVASGGLSESKLESRRKKVSPADGIFRPVPQKPKRVINSRKMKRTTVFSPPATLDAQRRKQPAIYYTEDPKIILTDPSEFMWLVQRLTGSRCTRSRCKKNKPQRSGDAMSSAQSAETAGADVSEPAGSIANSIALRGPESRSSKGSNDEEESVSTDFMNTSSESVSGFPISPTTKSVKSESTYPGDESPRGPLPLFDWFCSGFVTDDRNLAPSLFDSWCPGTLELPEHFTAPVSEPIPDSFMFPLPSFRDVDSSTLLDDVPWLLSS